MEAIPLSQIPAQQFTIVLDGQNCTISLRWLKTHLFMDLVCNNKVVRQGVICQNRARIIQRTPDFKGSLHFFDMQGDVEPHWKGLYTGKEGRWKLYYIPKNEKIPDVLRF